MAIKSVTEFGQAYEKGDVWHSVIYKTSQPAVGANVWFDGSVGSGIPIFNPYGGSQREFTPLIGQKNQGVVVGPQLTGGLTRYLANAQLVYNALSVLPLHIQICDYLGVYTLIDGEDITLQECATPSPEELRYTNGEGVQAFIVTQSANTATNVNVTITYTNSKGVSNRQTTVPCIGSTIAGALLHPNNPFINLQGNDSGIRSIEAVQLSAAIAGFVNVVLCKPLLSLSIESLGVPTEIRAIQLNGGILPEVKAGAFIQFLGIKQGTAAAAPLRCLMEFVWG